MAVDRDSLLVVFAVAALAPILADLPRRVRAPLVVVEIGLGIVAGPDVLDLARADGLVASLSDFGLAMLFFLAGLEIDLDELRGSRGRLALRGWALSLALGLAVAGALWAMGVRGAPVLVALALTTTSLGALVPILHDAGIASGPLGRHAFAAGAAGEFGPILALSLVLAAASGDPWRALLLVAFAVVAVGAGLVAARARPPRLVRLVRESMHSSGQLAVRLSVLLLAGLFLLASELGLDVVLGAFAAGVVVGLVARGEGAGEFRTKLEGIGYGFLVPVFFVATGLRFDLDGLLSDAVSLALVPGFAALFLVVRGVPALTLYRGELDARGRGSLALLSASALPLVVAITEVAVERGHLSREDAVSLVGAGMLSLLAFPLAALALARR